MYIQVQSESARDHQRKKKKKKKSTEQNTQENELLALDALQPAIDFNSYRFYSIIRGFLSSGNINLLHFLDSNLHDMDWLFVLFQYIE